jgi:hypothetical protein
LASGDGRNDSLGHCAKFCTYSVMDLETNKILDMVVVDKKQTALKSVNMEVLGFQTALNRLLKSGVKVTEVVTDARTQIRAKMSKYYNIGI